MQALNSKQAEKTFLNAVEASKLIGCHPKTVLRMVKLGQLKSVRMVTRDYVTRATVEAFIGTTR